MQTLFLLLFLLPWSASAAPAEILFHAGTRSILQQDIEANTVPAAAWNEYIFGKTNFDLPNYRQGLYGAEKLSGISLYAAYQFLAGKEPWIMAIEVSLKCRMEGSVFNADYSLDLSDPQKRFEVWYVRNRERFRALEPMCFYPNHSNTPTVGNWDEGEPYDLAKADLETQKRTQICGAVLNTFLNENEIKLVVDTVNDGSWYVRDRSCIDGIQGKPDDLFNRLINAKIDPHTPQWTLETLGDPVESGTFSSGSTILLLKLLSETQMTPQNFADLALAQESLKVWNQSSSVEKKPLELSNNYDDSLLLQEGFASAQRAHSAKHFSQFQSLLKARLTDLTHHLGEACQSHNGVPDTRRDLCDRMSARESRNLQLLFKHF